MHIFDLEDSNMDKHSQAQVDLHFTLILDFMAFYDALLYLTLKQHTDIILFEVTLLMVNG